jgi:hypothetical protein
VRFLATSGLVRLETRAQWQPNDRLPGDLTSPVRMPRVGKNEDDLAAHRASLEAKRTLPGIGNRMSRRVLLELDTVVNPDGTVRDATGAQGCVTSWRAFAAVTNAHAASHYNAAADALEMVLGG